MKKFKIFMMLAFVLAIGSAFATKNAGQKKFVNTYYRIFHGTTTPCSLTSCSPVMTSNACSTDYDYYLKVGNVNCNTLQIGAFYIP